MEIHYHGTVAKGKAENNAEPYTQISINGFVVVDAQGGVLCANVQLNEEYGFTDKVRRIKETFAPGTLHWMESLSFVRADREIVFYEPQARPVEANLYDAINAFFPIEVPGRDSPSRGEFHYAGAIYREGRGKLCDLKK